MITFTWPDVVAMVGNMTIPKGSVYGIPRGGSIVAALMHTLLGCPLATSPQEADFIVDDIYDSGQTADRWHAMYGHEVICLVDKRALDNPAEWVMFPWEEHDSTAEVQDQVTRLLQSLEAPGKWASMDITVTMQDGTVLENTLTCESDDEA